MRIDNWSRYDRVIRVIETQRHHCGLVDEKRKH